MARERLQLGIPLFVTLVVHAGMAAGLRAAELYLEAEPPNPPMKVSFEVKKEEPPPPKVEEPPPPPPPPPAIEKPVPKKKVARVEPHPEKESPPEPPAPNAPDEEPPAPQKIYTMPGPGTVVVNPGPEEGTATGRAGGRGRGTGGGGAPGATGAGTVSIAQVKRMPKPIGDYDFSRDYPDEARRRGIEGPVLVRLLVDPEGRVADVRLLKGRGAGLDDDAVRKVRKLRFEPALDDNERAVAVWIPWTVTYTLPQ